MREYLIRQMLGEDLVYGITKLFVDHAAGGNPSGHHRHLIGGVMVTEEPILSECKEGRDSARLYECELIIIPKNIYTGFRRGGGYRIDQILVGGYERFYSWDRKIMKNGVPVNLKIPEYSHELTEADNP